MLSVVSGADVQGFPEPCADPCAGAVDAEQQPGKRRRVDNDAVKTQKKHSAPTDSPSTSVGGLAQPAKKSRVDTLSNASGCKRKEHQPG